MDGLGKSARASVGCAHRVAYGPDGAELGTSLAPEEEGLVLADIDLGVISLAKHAADPVGHYARPDVTRLLINRTPGDRVVYWGESTSAEWAALPFGGKEAFERVSARGTDSTKEGGPGGSRTPSPSPDPDGTAAAKPR